MARETHFKVSLSVRCRQTLLDLEDDTGRSGANILELLVMKAKPEDLIWRVGADRVRWKRRRGRRGSSEEAGTEGQAEG